MPLAPQGGQPLANPYYPVIRTADATGVTLETNQVTVAQATGGRAYTLPPLSSVGAGAWILVMTVGVGGILTISPDGTDLIADGVGTQTIVLGRDVGALIVAKVLDGATAASWWRLVP